MTIRGIPTTAALLAGGLLGGFAVAQTTGIRSLGGVVFAVAGAAAVPRSWRAAGPLGTIALAAVYVGAMGGSHPLAKLIGQWPSVGVVTAATSAAAYLITDHQVVRSAPIDNSPAESEQPVPE